MTPLPPDPLASSSISELGDRLRSGATTCEAITAAYLARIDLLDSRLGAFTYIAKDDALAAARSMDRLLATGTDLGPLMGVPVAVKDLFTVSGMPTTAGSDLDISDLVQPEGSFVAALKRAGCIILGKTRTTEFALGGINLKHRMPWNPWDAMTQRTPGGSSSGSAVAMAAGLCAFSVGSDTGGSVRIPAALCGCSATSRVPGCGPSTESFRWRPRSTALAVFAATAGDAAIVVSTLTGQSAPTRSPLHGLKLGKPLDHFFDHLVPEVDACVAQVLIAP
jgi:aspartyl-tRNA(Asn)/glutamyl-tRNA(Gln) amidotransferase subunit A